MRRTAFIPALLLLAALAAGVTAGAQAGRNVTKICVISATGALGGNANGNVTTGSGTAGGVAQKGGAKASLAIVCNFVSNGVKISIPSHTVNMKTFVHGLGGACTASGSTVTCRLNTSLQKQGLAYGGGWKDTFAWKFTPQDSTSHNAVDGSCHVPMVITLTNNDAVTYTKKTATVCEFALGDVLR